MISGVDSGENTLQTTSGNECKCSWAAKRGEKLQLMIRRHWEQLAPSERGKLYGDMEIDFHYLDRGVVYITERRCRQVFPGCVF